MGLKLEFGGDDLDGLKLTLELAKTLIWPILMFGLALLFRRPVAALIDRINQVEGLGWKISGDVTALALEVHEAAVNDPVSNAQPALSPPDNEQPRDASAGSPASDAIPRPSSDAVSSWEASGNTFDAKKREVERLRTALDSLRDEVMSPPSTRSSVFRGWKIIEAALKDVAIAAGIDATMPVTRLMKELVDKSLISGVTINLVEDARQVRNRVKYGSESDIAADPAAAIYINSASMIAKRIRDEMALRAARFPETSQKRPLKP